MNQVKIDFTKYPDEAGFKKPGTSSDAAESVEPRAKVLRLKVLEMLKLKTLTSDECAELMGESVLSIRPRFSELSRNALIEETGERRKNESGKFAAVWRLRNGF